MNPAQSSITLLAFVIAAISAWWISITLKEGRQAIDESKKSSKKRSTIPLEAKQAKQIENN